MTAFLRVDIRARRTLLRKSHLVRTRRTDFCGRLGGEGSALVFPSIELFRFGCGHDGVLLSSVPEDRALSRSVRGNVPARRRVLVRCFDSALSALAVFDNSAALSSLMEQLQHS